MAVTTQMVMQYTILPCFVQLTRAIRKQPRSLSNCKTSGKSDGQAHLQRVTFTRVKELVYYTSASPGALRLEARIKVYHFSDPRHWSAAALTSLARGRVSLYYLIARCLDDLALFRVAKISRCSPVIEHIL